MVGLLRGAQSFGGVRLREGEWTGMDAFAARTGGGSSDQASRPARRAGTRLKTAMTKRDADQLNVWVETMPRESLALMWRWITLAYMQRCYERR